MSFIILVNSHTDAQTHVILTFPVTFHTVFVKLARFLRSWAPEKASGEGNLKELYLNYLNCLFTHEFLN